MLSIIREEWCNKRHGAKDWSQVGQTLNSTDIYPDTPNSGVGGYELWIPETLGSPTPLPGWLQSHGLSLGSTLLSAFSQKISTSLTSPTAWGLSCTFGFTPSGTHTARSPSEILVETSFTPQLLYSASLKSQYHVHDAKVSLQLKE